MLSKRTWVLQTWHTTLALSGAASWLRKYKDFTVVCQLGIWGPLPPCLSEEAVNEVKRQAMSELQKAVSDAERKAHEMISAERSKMERALAEAKRQASEDALTVINQQEDSSEVSITDSLS